MKGFRMQRMTRTGFAIALLFLAAALWGQPEVRLEGSVEWDRGLINAETAINLAQAGILFPFGRIRGEEAISEEYPRLIRPVLLSLPADSSGTVMDMIQRGEFSLEKLDALSLEAQRIAPSLSTDLNRLMGRYTLSLNQISAALSGQNRPRTI
jgi:hypothetical protein